MENEELETESIENLGISEKNNVEIVQDELSTILLTPGETSGRLFADDSQLENLKMMEVRNYD